MKELYLVPKGYVRLSRELFENCKRREKVKMSVQKEKQKVRITTFVYYGSEIPYLAAILFNKVQSVVPKEKIDIYCSELEKIASACTY